MVVIWSGFVFARGQLVTNDKAEWWIYLYYFRMPGWMCFSLWYRASVSESLSEPVSGYRTPIHDDVIIWKRFPDRSTVPLWGKFTGHWQFPSQRTSDADLWLFCCKPEEALLHRVELHVISDAMTPMWRHCNGQWVFVPPMCCQASNFLWSKQKWFTLTEPND